MNNTDLYDNQDHILRKIKNSESPFFSPGMCLLCGGTALSRLYLKHRVSYDLDFFIQERFSPSLLIKALLAEDIQFNLISETDGDLLATQIHGYITVNNMDVNVSFIEDSFAMQFNKATVDGIATEVIDGLYHRKLRTLTGTSCVKDSAGRVISSNGRQTARDLYDLYTLNRDIEPIDLFILRINDQGANFPCEQFDKAIRSVNWVGLMDEFKAIATDSPVTSFEVKVAFDVILNDLKRVSCESHAGTTT